MLNVRERIKYVENSSIKGWNIILQGGDNLTGLVVSFSWVEQKQRNGKAFGGHWIEAFWIWIIKD